MIRPTVNTTQSFAVSSTVFITWLASSSLQLSLEVDVKR